MISLNDTQLRKSLHRCLTRPHDAFANMGDTEDTPTGQLTYIDRGANVLAVAHLDYVMWSEPTMRSGVVRCPQLDDRLGAWIILDVLPALGIKCDVLLTDSEEIGQSTGQWFETEKAYNWMFQFDRAGSDVVMYQYHNADHVARLESCGWEVRRGAFSDISSMSHLGCAGFNFGVGYHAQHSEACYADLQETAHNVARFAEFYRQHAHLEMPYSDDPDRYHPEFERVEAIDQEWWDRVMREDSRDIRQVAEAVFGCPFCARGEKNTTFFDEYECRLNGGPCSY